MISNPVLRKEVMTRWRLRKGAPGRLGALLAILAGVGLFHWLFLEWLLNPNWHPSHSNVGEIVWQRIIGLQYTLLCLMTPALAANAITQEREQQTWEMLVFTRLTSAEIILGKLMGRMLPSLALLALCLPLTLLSAFAAMTGVDSSGAIGNYGVVAEPPHASIFDMVAVYAVMLVTALFFTTLGLFLSWCFRKTLYALMMSYTVVVGGLTIGTTMLTIAFSMLVQSYDFPEHFIGMWVNPVYMMWQALDPGKNGPLYMLGGLFIYLILTALMLWRMIAGFRRFASE